MEDSKAIWRKIGNRIAEMRISRGLTQYQLAEMTGLSRQYIGFIEQGIRAADLIDFDYRWWHTLEDTVDKLSEESLQAVYRVLYAYLTEK